MTLSSFTTLCCLALVVGTTIAHDSQDGSLGDEYNETSAFYGDTRLSTMTINAEDDDRRHLITDNAISFYVMADAPYGQNEFKKLPAQVKNMNRNKAEFAIHLGDMQDRAPYCPQERYKDFAELMVEHSELPMFVIPGDNDHYDCRNNPLKAWEFWQTHLGGLYENWNTPFPVRTQPIRPENFAFTYKNVLFIGLHTLGTKKIKDQRKWDTIERHASNWVLTQMENWSDQVESVVIFSHAYTNKANFPVLWQTLSDSAVKSKMPTLFLQGDAHAWVQGYPFGPAKDMMRVVVTRGGWEDPVLITIDTGKDKPFNFARRGVTKNF